MKGEVRCKCKVQVQGEVQVQGASGNIKKYIAVSGFSVTCVISVVSVRCTIALSSAVQCSSHAV